MKTKTIFKTLALAMLMPTMLLTTACSSDDNDIVNTENPANIQKGYALPVTVNVTRQGDDATTRASYNESTRKLSFTAGDKLFVMGNHTKAGKFAGTLDYDAVSGKFSGTIYTKNSYEGTADELFTDANTTVNAVLLPAGYESYGFFSIVGSGYEANFNFDFKKGFAPTKAAAVEQFSLELTFSYSSGFALAPMFALASFTISGLTANKKVEVSFDTNSAGVISGNVTTSAEGIATFALGLAPDYLLETGTLTVDGNNIAMPTATTVAGHIYNISRSVAAAPAATDLSTLTDDYEAKDGETLTGTLGSNVKISIADGATVTLKDVNINGVNTGDYAWAGITCAGDATITLEGTNTVKGFHAFYPGIYVPEGKTLTIEGEGSLNASGNGPSTGIGGGFYMHCGNIVINGGNITATGGNYNAGIGGGGVGFGDEGTVIRCGKITINGGTVTATGGESAAGIGCGYYGASNDITITGGTVTATGGEYAAGIGSGEGGSCGAINISGGTVTATAVKWAAGIGGGNNNGASGTITITSGVTKVTATKGSNCLNSIGEGDGGTAITVIIDDYDKVIQN